MNAKGGGKKTGDQEWGNGKGRRKKRDFKVRCRAEMVIPSGNSFLPKLFAIFAHKDGVSSRFTPPGNPDIQTHISSPHLIPSPASFFSKGKAANLQSVARGSCLFSNSFGADVTSPPCCLPVRLHFLYINSSTPARWTSAPLRWFIKRWSVIQTKYCERTSTETHLFFLFLQVSFPSSRGSDRTEWLTNLTQVVLIQFAQMLLDGNNFSWELWRADDRMHVALFACLHLRLCLQTPQKRDEINGADLDLPMHVWSTGQYLCVFAPYGVRHHINYLQLWCF